MASDINICNMALSQLGSSLIQALTDTTIQGVQCNLHYAFTRDEVLRDHIWNFAAKRATLAVLAEDQEGWDYTYSLPSDYIIARYIYDATSTALANAGSNNPSDPISFEVASNNDGDAVILLTNEEDAVLVYTAKITDTNMFDSLFIKLLSTKLAATLAIPVKRQKDLKIKLLQEYYVLLGENRVVDANEGQFKQESHSSFLAARG